jgi:hypothetical protein
MLTGSPSQVLQQGGALEQSANCAMAKSPRHTVIYRRPHPVPTVLVKVRRSWQPSFFLLVAGALLGSASAVKSWEVGDVSRLHILMAN